MQLLKYEQKIHKNVPVVFNKTENFKELEFLLEDGTKATISGNFGNVEFTYNDGSFSGTVACTGYFSFVYPDSLKIDVAGSEISGTDSYFSAWYPRFELELVDSQAVQVSKTFTADAVLNRGEYELALAGRINAQLKTGKNVLALSQIQAMNISVFAYNTKV